MDHMNVLLRTEVEDEIKKIEKMDKGSDAYKATVDGAMKLADRAIEIEKMRIESAEREKAQEFEKELKLAQIRDERKDRLIKNCLTAAGIAIPTMVTIWGTLKSLKFEESGTVTTIMGRGFINKLLPKK